MDDEADSFLVIAGAPATALGQLYVAAGQALAGASAAATLAQQAGDTLGAVAAAQGVTGMFAIDTVAEGADIAEIYEAE